MTKLSKKDYEKLAKILADNKASIGLTDDIATYLNELNPRFDKLKFVLFKQKEERK